MVKTLCPKQLFEGNVCPSEEEEATVRGHLSELTSKSSLLDAEITQLQYRLQSLQLAQTVLRDEIALHRPIISIARRIPFEILEQILFHCLPETRNPTMSVMDAPLKYARVCSYWRSVVYQAPRLWTRLHLAVPSSSYQPISYGGFPSAQSVVADETKSAEIQLARRRMRTAVEWLERACHYPVSISVACGPYNNVFTEVLDIMWDTILRFSGRWADIDIELPLPSNTTFNWLQYLCPENTPHLRSLRLRWLKSPCFLPPTAQTGWSQIRLMLASNLEALQLVGFSGAHNLDIAWPQITELTIEDCDLSPSEAHRILIECPNIRRCRLHISPSSAPALLVDSPVICLTHLELLTLFERGPFPAKIRAPNLKRFAHQAFRCDREHFDMFELLKDVDGRPAGRSLEALAFDPTTIHPNTIINFLSLTPNVKELFLEVPKTYISCAEWKWNVNSDIGDGFLQALMPVEKNGPVHHASKSPLCPKLERFKCTARAGFTDNHLLAFIRGRSRFSASSDWHGGCGLNSLDWDLHAGILSPLRQVVVNFDRPVEMDVLENLRGCSKLALSDEKGGGVDLRLTYKKTAKSSHNTGQLSPWNGIRSREAVPDCVDWVVIEEDILA
ncbi:hypothetical protein CVT24_004997 [Panaeolus cyanescens]|uniref:Uncharacterized protein n=1 Tax=Panaeolus cyanescens TaxID=181874 RepID=A0A409VD55_9AGAR|nr:hypothetical protein CVT24_004997 [Panaeolus cyanescens]